MRKLRDVFLDLLLRYLITDPIAKLPTILSLVEKLEKGHIYEAEIRAAREALADETGVWRKFAERLFDEVDRNSLQKMVEGLVINASMVGGAHSRALEAEHGCNIPWAILMDPTSFCNLSCIGCWAAQYSRDDNLSYETMDSICRQGKELGIHFYIFSGGESLVRKDDVIRLCEEHYDCYFLSFTNGTLVDEALCKDHRGLAIWPLPSPSKEINQLQICAGVSIVPQSGRSYGVHERPPPFVRILTCYHRYNTESVGSDEFVDQMISLGCRFAELHAYPNRQGAELICWRLRNSANICIIGFVKSARLSRFLPWIFGMTANTPRGVSLQAETIFT